MKTASNPKLGDHTKPACIVCNVANDLCFGTTRCNFIILLYLERRAQYMYLGKASWGEKGKEGGDGGNLD